MKSIIAVKKENSIHKVKYSNGNTLYFMDGKNITPEEDLIEIESIDEIKKRNVKAENKNYKLFQEIKSTYENILNREQKRNNMHSIYRFLYLVDVVTFIGFYSSMIDSFENLNGIVFCLALISWISYPLTIIIVLSMLYFKISHTLSYKDLHNKMTFLNKEKFYFKSKDPVYIYRCMNELEQKYVFNKWKL